MEVIFLSECDGLAIFRAYNIFHERYQVLAIHYKVIPNIATLRTPDWFNEDIEGWFVLDNIDEHHAPRDDMFTLGTVNFPFVLALPTH